MIQHDVVAVMFDIKVAKCLFLTRERSGVVNFVQFCLNEFCHVSHFFVILRSRPNCVRFWLNKLDGILRFLIFFAKPLNHSFMF